MTGFASTHRAFALSLKRMRDPSGALCAVLVWCVCTMAVAQGTPSGEYGDVPLGGEVQAILAPIAEDESVVYHAYTVSVPDGTESVTVHVESLGGDLDLAVNFGRPILDYEDVDHLDISDEPSPRHVVVTSGAGVLYIDVLNLLPEPAGYRLRVSTSSPAAVVNPLGGGAPSKAARDPFVGTFEGNGLGVQMTGGAGEYTGELTLNGQTYPFRATGADTMLAGVFAVGATEYPFTATLDGDVLRVESGGATYATQRVIAAPAEPTNPLGGAVVAPAQSEADPVLAQGAHGTLTQDHAVAFVEALEFSLQQAGYVGTFTYQEREQILFTLAQNYPTLPPSDQAVLAQARDIWNRVQANWASTSPEEQREFVLGVFVLAFGPESVQQAAWGGSGGGGGAGAQCGSIDDCMSQYADPQTYQDTMNSQGCWAAAGCSDYDPSDNSFTYDTPDGY